MPAGKDQTQEVLDLPGEDMGLAHMGDFLNAVKKKDKSFISCPIEDAFKSTATVQLAMISYNTKATINWDSQKYSIKDNPQASAQLARPYRGKYERPVV